MFDPLDGKYDGQRDDGSDGGPDSEVAERNSAVGSDLDSELDEDIEDEKAEEGLASVSIMCFFFPPPSLDVIGLRQPHTHPRPTCLIQKCQFFLARSLLGCRLLTSQTSAPAPKTTPNSATDAIHTSMKQGVKSQRYGLSGPQPSSFAQSGCAKPAEAAK